MADHSLTTPELRGIRLRRTVSGGIMNKVAVGLIAATISVSAMAQNIDPAPVAQPTFAFISQMDVPVIAGDITDRPYRVIAEIETDVRKATIYSKDPSQAKVYRELWERGKKSGADAVVNAAYGDPRVTALSWGARKATGQAIKFLSDEEIAQRAALPETAGLEDAIAQPVMEDAPASVAAVVE